MKNKKLRVGNAPVTAHGESWLQKLKIQY